VGRPSGDPHMSIVFPVVVIGRGGLVDSLARPLRQRKGFMALEYRHRRERSGAEQA